MTDDPLKRYLDDFGRQLDQAATAPVPRRRLRPRPIIALAGGLTSAVLLIPTLLAGAPGGSSRLDLVAQARAALTPSGVLVHTIVTQHAEVLPGHRDVHVSAPAQTTEQWSMANPPRWRIAFSYPDPKAHPGAGRVGDAHGPIVGPVQFVHAGDSEFTYYQQRNTLRIVRGLPPGTGSAIPGPTPLGNDPIATLRAMLQTGRLHDAGTSTVQGRQVRRLVGTTQRTFGKKRITTAVEYDVDPDTFAPVAARIELPFPFDDGPAVAVVLRFRRFETLPLTAQTRRLLEIHPVGHPKITVKKYRAHRRHTAATP
jgi:hypothetical protein